MGKIKVCMLTTTYPRFEGDVKGIFIAKLVKNLTDSGEVVVNVVKPDSKYQNLLADAGILYNLKKSFKAKLEFLPCMLGYFYRAIKDSKNCDIIHCNWIFSGIPGLIAKKIYKKPMIISIRGGEIHHIKKNGIIAKLWKFILKRTDIIVCVSGEIKEELNQIIQIKTEFILNGIDEDIFKPMNKAKTRTELKLNKNDVILIYVGRLIKEKGPLMLLDSLRDLKNEYVTLLYVGDGDAKGELIETVERFKLNNKVKVFGNISHDLLPKYLAASDIFVFPRFYEAGGNTLLEGASAGLPILGTNEGFVKDILNYKGVYLVEKNKESLRKGIEQLIKNKNLRMKLGKDARNAIINYGIGWKENSQKYLKLYKQMLRSSDEKGI